MHVLIRNGGLYHGIHNDEQRIFRKSHKAIHTCKHGLAWFGEMQYRIQQPVALLVK